ncbi:methionine synthase [soil metagenome]
MIDFLQTVSERVVVFDGALGTSVQALELTDEDFGGLEGCNEVLVRTRPDVIRDIHAEFLAVGCDAVETDTFGSAPWVLAEYDLADETEKLNEAAARLAREACDETPGTRFVIGSMGPGTRSPTLSLGKDPRTAKDFIDYDTMVSGYARQVRGLLSGGVDVLLVETVFDLLQAKAAIWACQQAMDEAGQRVPLMVQVTIEKDINTMLLGSEIGAAQVALDPLGVDIIGINCATGPEDMREQVRHLSQHSRKPISVIPNAGIPQMVDGQASYPLTPEALAAAHREFVEDFGVQIVGGCCGTTPEHLRRVAESCKDLRPRARDPEHAPSLSSLYAPVTIRQDNSFLIVGERLNANGSRAFRERLLAEDWEAITQMAREQVREGAHTLDVCVDYVGRDGAADVVQVTDRLATQSTLPLVIDSTEVKVVSAALRRIGGRAVINSVNLEDGRRKVDVLLPMAKQFGAAVVCLAIDEEGQARTADWKVRVCKQIADIAVGEYGMEPGDLIFDTLTFPLGSGQEDLRKDGLATLEAIARVKVEIPGCHTVLGVSNVSFGLSPAARQVLNSVFLHHAVQRGLDAAIVHPAKILPLHKIDDEARRVCEDLIFDRRRAAADGQGAYDPLHELMRLFEGATETRATREELAALPLGERLERRIVDGDRDGLDADLRAALDEGVEPLTIINTHLLAGMKVVGELFGSGQMQLPFVLQSAECMKAAVAYLEPHMEAIDDGGKGRIVLATVKGDVHDIGKNLVDIILSNNGYEVRNLGIKQPVDAIVAAAEDFKADAIGLSGLLVKSTIVMRENLEELNRRDLAHYPVVLGGAALTRGFVEVDLRNVYNGPVFYARDAFAGLRFMDELAEHRMKDGPPPDWGRVPSERKVAAQRRDGSDDTDTSAVARSNVATDVEVPTPPFWGSRVVRGLPLDDIAALLNTTALFRNQWGFDRDQADQGEAALRQTLAMARAEALLVPQVAYGYWPANSDGNDLIVWQPGNDRVAARFRFPRQTASRRLCIADFFRPTASSRPDVNPSGARDVIAFHAVTMGSRISERAAELFAADRYTEYLYLHGLGVEMAEALAEYWHARIRAELGIAGDDAEDKHGLFKQGYRGSRYSFGYAACPDLEARKPLFDLLDAGRIGLELSEEFQLHPEQSTDAIIVHHPEAKYFNAR